MTVKRYLHGPFAEYMYTMWPDMKFMIGPIVMKPCGYRSSAIKFLIGEDLKSIDFEATETVPRKDGIPVHKLINRTEEVTITAEACCNLGTRKPTAFIKLSLKNNTHRRVYDRLALLPRTGREDHLVGMEVDGYCHFDNNVYNYGFIPSDWTFDGKDYLTDGEYEVKIAQSDFEPEWQGDVPGIEWYKRKLLLLPFKLEAKEEKTLTLAFRPMQDEPWDIDFDARKAAAEEFWRGELAKIRRVPDSDAHLDVMNNLVAQSIQMFNYPVGEDYVIPRQGGLQRLVWPGEAVSFLTMLDNVGDFSKYTEAAYDTFFGAFTLDGGDEDGFVLASNSWSTHTAWSIVACSNYLCVKGTEREYKKYADKLFRAYSWIERTRQKSFTDGSKIKGIFPAMKATDWPGEYQFWNGTDCINLYAISELIKAFEKFGDPRTEEIKKNYKDYFDRIKAIYEEAVPRSIGADGKIKFYYDMSLDYGYTPIFNYSGTHPMNLIIAGIAAPDSEFAGLMEEFYRDECTMKNGLTGLMDDGLIFQGHNADPWAGHTWYTNAGDEGWFYMWMDRGETEKAHETLEALMYYGMTDAYYLNERYADNDPCWVPWMPNASANGRLIKMLMRFYGTREV